MVHDIQDILSKVYELEGLLLLAQNRAETGLDALLADTLNRKITEISRTLADMQEQIGLHVAEQTATIDKRTSDSIEALDAGQEIEVPVDEKFIKLESDEDDIFEDPSVVNEPSDMTSSESPQQDESYSSSEEYAEDEYIASDTDETTLTGLAEMEHKDLSNEFEEEMSGSDNGDTEDIEEAVKAEVKAQQQAQVVAEDEVSLESDDEMNSIKDEVIAQAVAQSKEKILSSEPSEFQDFIDLDELEDQQSVSDAYINKVSKKDLKRAFSINDKYYYRRVLFDNDATRFNIAIEKVQDMEYFDEAQQYFYDELHWDEDDRNVKRFMAIIESHFD